MDARYTLDFRYPHDPNTSHRLEVTLVLQEKIQICIDGDTELFVNQKRKPAEKEQ